MKRILFILSLLISIFLTTNVYAASGVQNRYFYNQLDDSEKEIYNAIVAMENTGILKESGDYTISNPGYSLSSKVMGVTQGNSSDLLQSFVRARDAYQYDNPDTFYVDFEKLSVRVVSDNNKANCIIGTGKENNYYSLGFSNKNDVDLALSRYNDKINTILNNLPQTQESGDLTLKQTQLRYLHDYLVNNMIYKFNYELSSGYKKINSTRTAYDALIYGEGVCESYTRAFKALCDRANIACIAVYGQYKYSKGYGEHAWNYVQIDDGNNWYAVDATQDDPIYYNISGIRDTVNEKPSSGRETYQYFLVGTSGIGMNHFSSGILSPTNYKEFIYPELSYDPPTKDVKIATDSLNGELKVKTFYSKYEGVDSNTIRVSYRGAGASANYENGYYLLMRTAGGQSIVSSKGDGYTDWFYIVPGISNAVNDSATVDPDLGGNFTEFNIPQVQIVQFAITTQKSLYQLLQEGEDPNKYTEDQKLNQFFYIGDPTEFSTLSDPIVNPYEVYMAPPYPTQTTPAMSGILTLNPASGNNSYNMSVTFNQNLVKNGNDPLTLEVSAYNVLSGTWNENIANRIKVENLNFDSNTNTVSWTFKPSISYSDNSSNYKFQIHGLVGENSNKEPIQLEWGVSYLSPCSLMCKQMGIDRQMYGNPSLLDNPDLTSGNWLIRDNETGKTDDLATLLQGIEVRDRLALITSTPTPAEQSSLLDNLKQSGMENGLGNSLDDPNTRAKIDFYQINLAYCSKTIYQSGEKIRVCIGFPNGVTYQEALKGNPELKMYHYKTDPATGKTTGEIEELPVTITPQGIIVTVDSFSPFAIVKTSNPSMASKIAKSIVLRSDDGGTIEPLVGLGGTSFEKDKDGENITSHINLEPNQAITFRVKANEGNVISSIMKYGYANSQVTEEALPYTTGSKESDITIRYEDLPEIGGITLGASFINATTYQKDNSDGKSSNFSESSITLPNSIFVNPGKPLSIQAKFNTANLEGYTIEWQKIDANNHRTIVTDSSDAIDSSDTILTVSKATYGDTGKYVVTATSADKVLTSNICSVVVGYQITFESNKANIPTQYRITVEDNTLDQTPILPSDGNARFAGWYTQAKGGEEITGDTVFNKDTTVYAHWTNISQSYKITLDPNGGTVGGIHDVSEIYTSSNGKLLIQLPLPQKENAIFIGWYTAPTGGSLVTQDTVFLTNTTIYAHWDMAYTITFNPNGGTLENNVFRTNSEGKLVSLPIPSRQGNYSCLGWYTESDGGERVTVDTVFTQNTTVYAHWQETKKGYTITLNLNGGTIEGNPVLTTLDSGKLPALPTPVKENTTFLGWYTAENEAVSTETVFKANTTIYAHWQDDSSEPSEEPGAIPEIPNPTDDEVTVYRIYNTQSGEHVYTTHQEEVNVRVSEGNWNYEGAAWYCPKDGIPVYRLYNPVLGNHLYTTDENEVRILTTQDIWQKDFNGEPLFYSGGNAPVYRLYNEQLRGDHLLTTDSNEYLTLPMISSWSPEGKAFYVLRKGK